MTTKLHAGTDTSCDMRSAPQQSLSNASILRLLRTIVVLEAEITAYGGGPNPNALRILLAPDLSDEGMTELTIGEDGLGFDSLSKIGLVISTSKFFDLGPSGVDDYLLLSDSIGDWVELISCHFAKAESQPRLVFSTSGSTDRPVLVPHGLTALLSEIKAFDWSILGRNRDAKRIVSMVPAHHIYGFLFSCLLPDISSRQVVNGWRRSPSSVGNQIEACNIIVGTPFDWANLLSCGIEFPEGCIGIVSAGPCPKDIWQDTKNSGLSRLIEIYGSTETGGVGWRDTEEGVFKMMPHLVQRNQEVFLKNDLHTPLPLQDNLIWASPNEFILEDRRDKAVQVAGVNVSLKKVRDVLLSSPLVTDAVVRLDGERLKAFVVAKPGPTAHLKTTIRSLMCEKLPPVARPMSLTFGYELPRNEMGKPADWEVADPRE